MTNLAFKTIDQTITDIKKNHGDYAINTMLYKDTNDAQAAYEFIHKLRIQTQDINKKRELDAKLEGLQSYILQCVDINLNIAGIKLPNPLYIPDPQKVIDFIEYKKIEDEFNSEKTETGKVIQMIPNPNIVVTTEEVEKTNEQVTTLAHTSYYLTGNPKGFNQVINELKESYSKFGTILSNVQNLIINDNDTKMLFNHPIYFLNDKNLSDNKRLEYRIRLNNLLVSANIDPNHFIIDDNKCIPTLIHNWELLYKTSDGKFKNKDGKIIEIDNSIKETNTEELTVAKIQEEYLNKLLTGSNMSSLIKEFTTKLNDSIDFKTVIDTIPETNKKIALWKEVVKKYYELKPDANKVNQENKEEIIDTEIISEETINKDKAEEFIKDTIIKAQTDKSINIFNTLNVWLKKTKAFKLFGNKKTSDIINDIKKEIAGTTSVVPSKTKSVSLKFKYENISIEKEELLTPINSCGNDINLFKDLLIKLVYEKHQWNTAMNVAMQYYQNFDDLKPKKSEEVYDWVVSIINEIKNNKKPSEITTVEPTENVELGNENGSIKQSCTTSETENLSPKTDIIESNIELTILDKYKYIATEDNRNRIKKGINDFLLNKEYNLTPHQKIEIAGKIVKLNNRYKLAKSNELENFIKTIIKANKNIEKLFAA